MSDRSIISKKYRHNQRMTRDQLITLRMTVASSESKAKPIGSMIGTVIQDIMHYCSVTTSGEKNRVCQNYGHRLGPRGKDDQYLCADCKAVISGPADLRKSSPQHQTKEVCDGSWRSDSRTRR